MSSEVILYHQEGCPQCIMVKALLDKRGVSYASCEDKDKMLSLGIQHTPTLSVDGKLITGKEMIAWINGKRD